ncbi:PfkB family carbohydrate kinase, partial [Microbispora rosea]
MSGPLVIVGDSLLDVDVEGTADRLCPDAPVPVVEGQAEHHRPGGAGLAALLAARDGTRVVLITALGDDPSGRCLEDLLSPTVEIVRLPLRGTTVRKARVRARGQTLVRIDTGDGRAMGRPGQIASASAFARAADALAAASAVLVADYGRGVADLMREPLRGLDVPLVWDPHPRGSLPVRGCALVTPSEAEARGMCEEPYVSPERTARRLVRDLDAEAVAITLGERGAMLARRGGRFGPVPVPHAASGTDACGAGDRFAAAAALALADGASTEDAVARAVGEATRFVEEGGAAALRLHHSGQHRPGRHCPAAEPPVPFAPGASAFEVAAAV